MLGALRILIVMTANDIKGPVQVPWINSPQAVALRVLVQIHVLSNVVRLMLQRTDGHVVRDLCDVDVIAEKILSLLCRS